MTTYVFAWNPRLWNWPELPRKRRSIRSHGHVDIRWACGRTRSIEPGSRTSMRHVVPMAPQFRGSCWMSMPASKDVRSPSFWVAAGVDALRSLRAHPPGHSSARSKKACQNP